MKKFLNIIAFLLPLIFSFTGCDLINPAETVPSYVLVEQVTVQTQPGQGSSSHKITDLWVSINGNFHGIYPLPAQIPFLETGTLKMEFQAGIKINGINATPGIYPSYDVFEQQIPSNPGETLQLTPVFTYKSSTNFIFIENFEGSNHLFRNQIKGTSANAMVISSQEPFEGQGSGLIVLSKNAPEVEIGVLKSFSGLSNINQKAFLELNYRSDIPVQFGIVTLTVGQTNGPSFFDPGFREKNTWNKIYFDLSPLLISNASFGSFQVALRAKYPDDGSITLPEARIYLDNVKFMLQ